MGVLHILVGHSGPETAADGRTHFGIFAPQVWKLFPRGPDDSSEFLGLQRRGARLLRGGRDRRARAEGRASSRSKWRGRTSRWPTAARFADTDIRAAAKGFYLIRDFAPGKPRHGYVITQGSSSTVNLVSVLPKLEAAGVNVRVDRRHQRGAVRSPAGGVSPCRAAAGGALRPDGGVHGHAPHVAAPRRGAAHRRVLADVGLGQPVAHRRPGARRDRRSAPRCRRRSWPASRASRASATAAWRVSASCWRNWPDPSRGARSSAQMRRSAQPEQGCSVRTELTEIARSAD